MGPSQINSSQQEKFTLLLKLFYYFNMGLDMVNGKLLPNHH